MKKIIFAAATAVVMLAFSSTAEARRHSQNTQYSTTLEEPDLVGSVFGDWGDNVTPIIRFKSKKQARRYYENREANYGFDRADESYSGSIVALGHELQSQGFRVSEHPSFGGVHHVHAHHSAHYSGRALDINIGRGVNEAHSKYAYRFDQLAVNLRAEGYKVLWRVPGHYGHLHVQY